MSKITKDEALKLALESLEPLTINAELRGDSFPEGNEIHKMADAGFKAITAIREALAHAPTEREQPAPSSHLTDEQKAANGLAWLARLEAMREEFAGLAEQPAPVAEPHEQQAGHTFYDGNGNVVAHLDATAEITMDYSKPSAWAQRKPWVGLTMADKKEIERVAVYVDGAIRLTEAKLREKNT